MWVPDRLENKKEYIYHYPIPILTFLSTGIWSDLESGPCLGGIGGDRFAPRCIMAEAWCSGLYISLHLWPLGCVHRILQKIRRNTYIINQLFFHF